MTTVFESVKCVGTSLRTRHSQYYTYVEALPPYLMRLLYGHGSAAGNEQKNYNLTKHNGIHSYIPHELQRLVIPSCSVHQQVLVRDNRMYYI
jgi:hypothetical protein